MPRTSTPKRISSANESTKITVKKGITRCSTSSSDTAEPDLPVKSKGTKRRQKEREHDDNLKRREYSKRLNWSDESSSGDVDGDNEDEVAKTDLHEESVRKRRVKRPENVDNSKKKKYGRLSKWDFDNTSSSDEEDEVAKTNVRLKFKRKRRAKKLEKVDDSKTKKYERPSNWGDNSSSDDEEDEVDEEKPLPRERRRRSLLRIRLPRRKKKVLRANPPTTFQGKTTAKRG